MRNPSASSVLYTIQSILDSDTDDTTKINQIWGALAAFAAKLVKSL